MEFYIFVTKRCNLNCRYCSIKPFLENSKSKTKELDVKKTAYFVLKNLSDKKNNVVFYGGEPLLNQKWIKIFIKLTKNNNLIYTLQTNGKLLDKMDDFILQKLDFIHLSLDGDQEINDRERGKGVYKIILANIHKIKTKFKGKLLARMTLIPQNSIYDSVTHLLNLNLFDYIYWQLEISPIKNNFQKIKKDYRAGIKKLVDFWIKNLKEGKVIGIVPFQVLTLSILNRKQYQIYRCGAGNYLVTIDSDGSCYSCDELIKPSFKIGNIINGVKQKELSSKNRRDFCLNCDILKICGGRCFSGSLLPQEKFRFYCDMTRILIKAIQGKMPQIKSLVKNNKITIKDLEYDCFTEEIP